MKYQRPKMDQVGSKFWASRYKQVVLNPQMGLTALNCFKLSPAIWIYHAVASWRSESSNINLVILDKLLYYSRNHFFFKNYKIEDRPMDRRTSPMYQMSLPETKNSISKGRNKLRWSTAILRTSGSWANQKWRLN